MKTIILCTALLTFVFLMALWADAAPQLGQSCEGWEAPARIDGEWVCLDLEEDLGLID